MPEARGVGVTEHAHDRYAVGQEVESALEASTRGSTLRSTPKRSHICSDQSNVARSSSSVREALPASMT